ncbi:hypothetical protein BU17DRAFT_63771 [Hysterangium stoloniferum]|nr:hypothetical protein BU17DRAFT_63771 [Hysterangium stoloniferum]
MGRTEQQELKQGQDGSGFEPNSPQGMGRVEQERLKQGHNGSGSQPNSHQGIESSCSSPFAKLPMELILVIVEFASRDYWTACSLSVLSKAIRGCIPAIFFRTIALCPPYPSANRTLGSMIKYSDMENIFITMATDNDQLVLYHMKPKHLCIQLLGMCSAPLPSSLTHFIIQVYHYDMSWFFHYFRPQAITHLFIRAIDSSECQRFRNFPFFYCRRLEALILSANSCDVLEQGFERFLDRLDGAPQLQVVGLCPYHFNLDRTPSVSYTEMKRSLAGLTHRNASRVVAMPPEDITVSQWYDWLQPDEESVWDKARRLLKEKQESIV